MRIQKYDNNFIFVDSEDSSSSSAGKFIMPTGIAVNSTGFVFVVDSGQNSIHVFNSILDFQFEFNATDSLTSPVGIAINSTDHILVSDFGNDRIVVFEPTGAFKNEFGSTGSGDNEFDRPTGIAINSSDEIYIADSANNRIQKFDSHGAFLSSIDSALESRFEGFIKEFELFIPNIQAGALDLDSNKVMIGDWNPGNEKVIIANRQGGNLIQHDVSSFVTSAQSLAFNSANNVFISDPQDNTIVVINGDDGSKISEIDVSDISDFNIEPTGLEVASGLLAFPDNQLFVFDNSTERIMAIDVDNNSAEIAFNATNLFNNLIDIATNGTHIFGLDKNQDSTSIVEIRADKGITQTIEIKQKILDQNFLPYLL